MGGTSDQCPQLLGTSLAIASSSIYERRADGYLLFHGERPGADWVVHGVLHRRLWTLVDGEPFRAHLLKTRWRQTLGGTCHSRPPDDVAQVWFCSLVIVLSLWAWVASGKGVHAYDDAFPSLAERPSRRTVQRWMARALALAMTTQQLLRQAVIERGEPRPMKRLFPTGLAPPLDSRRRWENRPKVESLWAGLEIVVDGAVTLDVPLPLLLAEARRRMTRGESFLL